MPERKSKTSTQIRITSDGELWSLPTAQEIQEQKNVLEQESAQRAQLTHELRVTQEKAMRAIMQRLKELNRVGENQLFLEIKMRISGQKGEEEILIPRNYHVWNDQRQAHPVFLLITPRGFYAIPFELTMSEYRNESWPRSFNNFCRLLKPEVTIDYRYIDFREDSARLYFQVHFPERYSGDSISERAQLLNEEDQELIEACLEKSLEPLRTEQTEAETKAAQAEADIIALQSQIVVADRIKDILPEPPSTETNYSLLQNWWRGKKKR